MTFCLLCVIIGYKLNILHRNIKLKINDKIYEMLKNNYKSEDIWNYWASKVFTFYNTVFIVGFTIGILCALNFDITKNITKLIFNSAHAEYVQPNYTNSFKHILEKL